MAAVDRWLLLISRGSTVTNLHVNGYFFFFSRFQKHTFMSKMHNAYDGSQSELHA